MKNFLIGCVVGFQFISVFILSVQLIRTESRLRNEQRLHESLRRTVGKGVNTAYVCYGGGAKAQLQALLEN